MDVKEIRERIEYVLSINPQMVMDGNKKHGDPEAISYNYKMILRPIIDALSAIDPEAIKRACAAIAEKVVAHSPIDKYEGRMIRPGDMSAAILRADLKQEPPSC
jgi:hypothetical protein